MDILKDRTTAMGLFNFASSYQLCAKKLVEDRPKGLKFDAPIYFLLWHAAELLLKSFLRSTGVGLSKLRGLGHDHSKLYRVCVEHGLAHNDFIAEVLAAGSRAIEDRYILTGFKRKPTLADVVRACADLTKLVRGELRARDIPAR